MESIGRNKAILPVSNVAQVNTCQMLQLLVMQANQIAKYGNSVDTAQLEVVVAPGVPRENLLMMTREMLLSIALKVNAQFVLVANIAQIRMILPVFHAMVGDI